MSLKNLPKQRENHLPKCSCAPPTLTQATIIVAARSNTVADECSWEGEFMLIWISGSVLASYTFHFEPTTTFNNLSYCT